MSESAQARVEFLPSGACVWVAHGTTVLEAARKAGVAIAAGCGSRGVCFSCAVKVVAGSLAPPDDVEASALKRCPPNVRLACRARVDGPVSLRPVTAFAQSGAAAEAAPEGEVVLAVDLGTTNVACVAVELDGGREVCAASVPNRQQSWGADVLSRIAAAVAGEAEALARAAEESVVEACSSVCAGVDIRRIVISGNTAMAALLTRTDLSSLAAHPFALPQIPTELPQGSWLGRQLGVDDIRVLPALAGFVGGDTLAGLIHTGMLYAEQPCLLVDLGTNAEIAVVTPRGVFVASAAAGPAFEGAGIDCGGPAATGAVTRVEQLAGDRLRLDVLGDGEPLWLSGSGLISAAALLLRLGHLQPDGLMVSEGPLSSRFLARADGVLAIRLTDGDRVNVSQTDIRSLQLAKAAVRVGIEAVAGEAGVSGVEFTNVYVAGAFGGALNIDDLISLGILPSSTRESVTWIGNASLAGTTACALDETLLPTAVDRARDVHHVDLASLEGFSAALMKAVTLESYDV